MSFKHNDLLFPSSQIIKIKDIIPPPDKEKFNDVYIVYELMDTDLHQIIRSSQALTDDHCQVMDTYHAITQVYLDTVTLK